MAKLTIPTPALRVAHWLEDVVTGALTDARTNKPVHKPSQGPSPLFPFTPLKLSKELHSNLPPRRSARLIVPATLQKSNEWGWSRSLQNGAVPMAVSAVQIGVIALMVLLFNQLFSDPKKAGSIGTEPIITKSTTQTFIGNLTEPSSSTVGESSSANAFSFITKGDSAQLLGLGYALFVAAFKAEAALIGATVGAKLSPAGALAANYYASKKLIEPWIHTEPADMRNAVGRIDTILENLFASVPLTMGPDLALRSDAIVKTTEKAELLIHFRNDILLDRPFAKREVEAMKSPATRHQLRGRIVEETNNYPEKLKIFCRVELMTLAWRSIEIETEFDADGNELDADEEKHVLDLRGVTGSGKTLLINLAQRLLGLARIPIEYPDDESEGPAAMMSRPWDAILSSEPTNDHALLGLVLEAMFAARCSNPLLDFAEIDYGRKNLRNAKKRLEDASQKTLKVMTLNVSFDTSALNFMDTSNDLVVEPANKDRAHKRAIFDEVSPMAHLSSARKGYARAMRMFCNPRKDGSPIALDAHTQQPLVESLFNSVLPHLLDLAARHEASARLLFVQDLTIYIADLVDAGTPPTLAGLRNYVSDFFEDRTPGATVDESRFGQASEPVTTAAGASTMIEVMAEDVEVTAPEAKAGAHAKSPAKAPAKAPAAPSAAPESPSSTLGNVFKPQSGVILNAYQVGPIPPFKPR